MEYVGLNDIHGILFIIDNCDPNVWIESACIIAYPLYARQVAFLYSITFVINIFV